jgi:FMN-dependent NADH-azoreductase
MNLLYIDASIRPASLSRTHALGEAFREAYLRANPGVQSRQVLLREERIAPFDYARLELKERLIAAGDWDHEMFRYARAFAAADRIVIAAPYWDLNFPALLKIYFENIFVAGLTYRYGDQGVTGLCRAAKLLYLTTAGGFIHDRELGSDYCRALAAMFGIPGFQSLKAEGLDIRELDTTRLLEEALEKARELARRW